MSVTLRYDWSNREAKTASGAPLTLTDLKSSVALTLTRATTATVMDYNNVLKTVNSGEERYTGGRRVENICKQSEDFSTTWTAPDGATVTTNSVVAPDGTITADSLVEDGTTGLHYITQTMTVADTTAYTCSVYLKANTRSWALVYSNQVAEGTYFNLSAGTIGSDVGSPDAKSIEDVGNGWYRCSVTFTSESTVGILRVYTATADATINYASDNGTSAIFIWGAQVENVSGQDDPAPSTYIPTTTAAVSKWYATKRRTNLLFPSEDLSSAPTVKWSAGATTVLSNQIVSPDGLTTGNKVTETTANAVHTVRSSTVTPTVTKIGDTYVYSIYAKVGANADHILLFSNDGSFGKFFNISAGTAGGTTGVNAPVAFSITDAGNGWYRCSITVVASTATTSVTAYMSPDGATVSYTGATANYVYLWGAQIEKASTATAYIPTTTTVASSDFDTAITPTGLLVEEARTNLCLYSEDLSDAWWNDANSTVTANAAVAPDGTTTADDLIHTSAAGFIAKTGTFTVAADTAHTLTFYVKQGTSGGSANFLGLLIYEDATSANRVEAWYNLSTYATATVQNGGTGTGAAANIESVGNGWYRCSLSGSPNNGATAVQIQATIVTTDATYTRDVTNSLLLWGAQLEAGSFPTSYIPTTTASVTRNKEDIQTALVGTQYNDNAGTVYVQGVGGVAGSLIGNRVNLDFTDGGAGADRLQVYMATDNPSATSASSGGASGDLTLEITVGAQIQANTVYRQVVAIAPNDGELWADGVRAGTGDQSVDVPTGVDTLHVGQNYVETGQINGHIAEIIYDNTRLTNAELEDWSNGTNLPVSASITGILYPRDSMPTDEARFQTFIDDSGITQTGDLSRDYRAALHTVLGVSGNDIDYDLPDLFKRYYDSL